MSPLKKHDRRKWVVCALSTFLQHICGTENSWCDARYFAIFSRCAARRREKSYRCEYTDEVLAAMSGHRGSFHKADTALNF